MLAAVGEQGEDFNGSVLNGRGEVLHRHRRNRRLAQPGAQVDPGPGGVADLKACDGSDPDQSALDPAGPVGGVAASTSGAASGAASVNPAVSVTAASGTQTRLTRARAFLRLITGMFRLATMRCQRSSDLLTEYFQFVA